MLVAMINSFSLTYSILHKFVQCPEGTSNILFYLKSVDNQNGALELSKVMILIPLCEYNMIYSF